MKSNNLWTTTVRSGRVRPCSQHQQVTYAPDDSCKQKSHVHDEYQIQQVEASARVQKSASGQEVYRMGTPFNNVLKMCCSAAVSPGKLSVCICRLLLHFRQQSSWKIVQSHLCWLSICCGPVWHAVAIKDQTIAVGSNTLNLRPKGCCECSHNLSNTLLPLSCATLVKIISPFQFATNEQTLTLSRGQTCRHRGLSIPAELL